MIDRIEAAGRGAQGSVVLLSPNPMHDTGGGQRSAQLALELARRDWRVVFVAHGEVTETVDLGRRCADPRIVHASLAEWSARAGRRALDALLGNGPVIALGQVPVAPWLRTLRTVRAHGGVGVFDLIDNWDSDLGRGWYRPRIEARVVRASDVLTASAPVLAARLESLAGRAAHLLPNAYNQQIFRADAAPMRPPDLPAGAPIALYVGSLWGSWMDWTLVRALATELPRVAFVFVGDHRGEGGALPPNCHFIGLAPQDALPGYVAHAAVGFLPWRVDEITRATSPLKVYEYLAMGLPVVAPPLEPLAGLPGVDAAAGVASVAAALRARVERGRTPAEAGAMAAFASASSWAARVDALLELTEAAATEAGRADQRGRQRASSRKPRLQWSAWSWK